jgi:hypothetical protein
MDIPEIILMYQNGVSISSMRKMTGLTPPKIYKILRKYSISPNRGFPDTTCCMRTELTGVQAQVVSGLLLGDGCLRLRGRTPNLLITTIQREWAESLMIDLPLQFSFYTQPARVRKTKSGVIINSKETYQIQSKVDLSLFDFYKKWYNGEKKHIPSDLSITPNVMKQWFYGDGSTTRDGNRVKLTFCTDSFTIADCEILRFKVFEQTGVQMNIRMLRGNPRLYSGKILDVNQLLNYMKFGNMLNCFLYKWKYASYCVASSS